MKVLLLNPPTLTGEIYMKELGRCGRKSVADEIWPQTGLAYLAAIAEGQGHKTMIIDSMAEKIGIGKLLLEINGFRPKIIIANTTTPTFKNDAKIFKLIREKYNCYLGFVGTHVSVLPKESLENSVADFLIINEAEYTLIEFLMKIDHSWKKIKGLCYKKNNKIFINTQRKPAKNLDLLPFPARHLLPNNKYTMPLTKGKPFATIISSRGCPYNCIFCRAGSVWGKGLRTRSVESVFREIKYVVDKLKINYVVFMTDTFTFYKKWVLDLCNKLIKEKLKVKWLCNSRVDTIDEEMLIKMKKAGCISISFGIESGSQSILDISKKRITLKDSKKAVMLCKKTGIPVFAYFIIGLPGETWKTIKETINFAKKLDTDYAIFHIATPFPGTELYYLAKKNNWLVSNDWKDYEEGGSAVIRTENLTAEDLVKAQKMAMKAFYIRPKKVLKQVLKIRNFNDLKSRIKFGLKLFKETGFN